MSNIYVPIDYSNVKDVIPEGEDITYSTLVEGTHFQKLGKTKKSWEWESHLLMTDKSVAVRIPKILLYSKKELKELEPREEICVPRSNIFLIGTKTFGLTYERTKFVKLTLS